MGEPLTRGEAEATDGPLAQAAGRLDRALACLEAAFGGAAGTAPEPQDDRADALAIELDVARRRQCELEAAAVDASRALGHAMAEVRRTLDEDAARQGVFDFVPEGLEIGPASPEEGEADEAASQKEPAA